MEITRKEAKKMCRLAKEGKQISKIWREDFKDLTYDDVYLEVYGTGEKSAVAIKRLITTQLNKLVDSTKGDRKVMVEELTYLVSHLYRNHKSNQKKLSKIRATLEE